MHIGFFYPAEAEDISDFFIKTDAHFLGRGFEVEFLEIFRRRFGFFAKE